MDQIDEGLSRAAGHEGDVAAWEKSPAGKAFIAQAEAKEEFVADLKEKLAKVPKPPEPKAEFAEAEDEVPDKETADAEKALKAPSKKAAPKK